MQLHRINPFIRYAEKVNYLKKEAPFRAHDARLFFILENGGSILTENETFPLFKSAVIYIPPGTQYHFECSGNRPVVFYSINFDFSCVRDNIKQFIPLCDVETFISREDATPVPTGFENIQLLHKQDALLKDIETICLEYQSKAFGYEAIISALLKAVLVTLIRKANSQTSMPLALQIMEYIHTNYMNDISIVHISEVFNYNHIYLNRVFKKQTGKSIHDYLMKHRIRASKRFISTTNYSLLKIAELCGFKNPAHFSQSFKRITGVTPSEFKKQAVSRL